VIWYFLFFLVSGFCGILYQLSGQAGISSGAYYLFSGLWLAFSMVPWCACMGATIPLAMCAIRREPQNEARRSFSFLYLANLMGAVAGAILPLAFVEVLGFRGALRIGTALNFAVALSAVLVSVKSRAINPREASRATEPAAHTEAGNGILVLLFLTGLTTMCMEVVWIRLFTPSIGPMVYSFALILASYLFATFYGSRVYRFWSRNHLLEGRLVWITLPLLGLLPLLTTDLRVPLAPGWRVFLGVAPFSGVIGFLTSMLVDRWSGGEPSRAGRAYAVNVLGCIVGPLLGGFLLLPFLGERFSLLVCVLPFIAIPALRTKGSALKLPHQILAFSAAAGALFIFFWTNDFESRFARRAVLRDSTATVIATTDESTGAKYLLVNGMGMTDLKLITKMMAHLTLASHKQPPQETLIICFGMGTTFRSGLSWGIPTTVVDLVPSVPKLFPYYHPDAAQVVASPLAHIIVDDGRRYLERSSRTYDSIIVDPPPPGPAAGSSLLYSADFYALVKEHLRNGGIFQQWLPRGDRATQAAVARALKNSFPYVRVFQYRGSPGWYYLASLTPIPLRSSAELASRMPPKAAADLTEWGPASTPEKQFDLVLQNEVTLDSLIHLSPETPPLQDDRPINEYYFLRTPCLTCQPAVEYVRQHLNAGISRVLVPSVATSLH
jgi:spermidine synthase